MANAVYESNLDAFLKASDEKLARAAEIIGGMMETNAKLHVTDAVYSTPAGTYIRTGNLRNSITHQVESGKDEITIAVGSNVEYAPFVELGTGKYADGGRQTPWRYQDAQGNWHTTSGMPARPYLRPAVEDHIQQYKTALETELKE